MSDTVLPVPEPHLFLLNHTSSPLFSSWQIGIWPYAFDYFVFPYPCKDLGDVGEEAVHFIGTLDHDARVGEGEADIDVAAVAGAVYKGEEPAFQIGGIPVRDSAF